MEGEAAIDQIAVDRNSQWATGGGAVGVFEGQFRRACLGGYCPLDVTDIHILVIDKASSAVARMFGFDNAPENMSVLGFINNRCVIGWRRFAG